MTREWLAQAAEVWAQKGDLILLGVGVFVGLVLVLSLLVLLAKLWLVPEGEVPVVVNDELTLKVPAGTKLMWALVEHGIHVPSACGGQGTCGQCRLIVEGVGPVLPTERARLPARLLREGWRLSCQIPVKRPLKVRVPPEVLGSHTWIGTVVSNRNLTPLIKEPVIELPLPPLRFRAGQFILLEAPRARIRFADFDIDPRFREDWDRFDWWRYQVTIDKPSSRAYSMANAPAEGNRVRLNVRLQLPPQDKPEAPPGRVSSYVFSLKPGDQVKLTGPFGEFYVRERDTEMIFIGGGAGMAPLRSMIVDQLERVRTSRKISFWYGARSLRELFYAEEFERLARAHDNFRWQVALSEPRPEDDWQGPTGFIHQVLYDLYLKDHPAPEECDYYLCGPPPMLKAVLQMLDELGVERDNIFFDDFGG
ncbi:Na+-transporting NADH:ubiquinone oxidoreductase subunit F [Methylomarinovum tepidoasis]|uniref:Na(+)-translocating NADH-quinone reductase subunit F n=1 Tax=Methylomarinovum tepidoasis TaxID=2840183 RepID=A0AAU9BXV9_9GAMM|nr:NADH:ubiquinone reductase (Na(+)-transporting) subunit F [Methylomarinovum sp. IN45]BCX88318.1 Na+-transporting NADH:ubiquinone oxidoreductase subunit F [Methylomarinovum sp. IN45]